VKKPVLLLTLLLSCLFMSCCYHDNREAPRAEKGVLDLHLWDFENRGPVSLSGEWEFYWNQFVSPQEFKSSRQPELGGYALVPGTWREISPSAGPLPGTGYATYRLTIILPQDEKTWAIRFKTVSTAFRCYINEREAFSSGVPGRDSSESKPLFYCNSWPVRMQPGRNEIVLHISNFHYRDGGPWRTISFGLQRQIYRQQGEAVYSTLILFGGLFLMTLFFLGFWLMRKEEKAFLYFTIFCFLMTIRNMVTGEYLLAHIFPSIPFRILITLEYLTIMTGAPVFWFYVMSLYPDFSPKVSRKTVGIISGIFCLTVLIAPMKIFTWSIIPFEGLTLLFGFYLLYVIIRNLKEERHESLFVLTGTVIILITLINDILFANFIIPTTNMIHFGILFFILFQSFAISLRLTNAFRTTERLAKELNNINLNLETKVQQRTIALEKAYNEIKTLSVTDPLTGCYNRRLMNEKLHVDITRCARYGKSLSVILCDIDHFKDINDINGHQAGDHVLVEFSLVMKRLIRGDIDWICRYGGEEFLIVLPETTLDNAVKIAERMKATILQLEIFWQDRILKITSSFGVTALDPGRSEEPYETDKLISRADELLYQAKNSGRNLIKSGGLGVTD
jgi:diguanylate cyclase (GGDEF)-like protein